LIGTTRGNHTTSFNNFLVNSGTAGQARFAGISLNAVSSNANDSIISMVFRVEDAATSGGQIQLTDAIDFASAPALSNTTLTISNVGTAPYILKADPTVFVAGIASAKVNIQGLNFSATSKVIVDNQAMVTEFVNSTALRGYLTSAPLANVGAPTLLVREGAIDSNTVTLTVMQQPSFNDVPSSHIFSNYVETFRLRGITAGCSTTPPRYCVDDPTTRGQMAVFILASMDIPKDDSLPALYNDIQGHYAYGFIQKATKLDIVFGCSANSYCPDLPLTRAEMAVFVIKAMGLPPDNTGSQVFDDVPPSHPYYGYINTFYKKGITAGCSSTPKLYCPEAPVSRGQMAVFLTNGF
jgi:hypothetical protein